MSKRPAFQFYPGDWRRDTALQSVSLAARGLWIELLCLMHDGEPYGHLAVNGRPLAPEQVARMVGLPVEEYARLFAELSQAGIPAVALDGVVSSRRMVRDQRIRAIRQESGRRGGAAAAQAVARFAQAKPEQNAKQTTEQSVAAAAAAVGSCSSGMGDRGAGEGGCADLFTDPAHRDAYLGHYRAAQNPGALDGEIRAMLSGMRGGAFAPEDVGQALVDLLMKGTKPSGLTLSRFAQVAKSARESPAPTRNGGGDGLSMDRVRELEARIKQREEAARAAS